MLKQGDLKQHKCPAIPMFILVTAMLLVTSCRFWERSAPQRSFGPKDLLISEDTVPSDWEVAAPFFPEGDELCTTECAAIPFAKISNGTAHIVAGQEVYRYRSAGIAQRTFEAVYLKIVAYLDPVAEWTYQNPVASQWHVGCGYTAGNVHKVCWWGGVYEEYIVALRVIMIPGEVSLPDMENVIRAIDTRMAEYLEIP